jgi:hypothetical protein
LQFSSEDEGAQAPSDVLLNYEEGLGPRYVNSSVQSLQLQPAQQLQHEQLPQAPPPPPPPTPTPPPPPLPRERFYVEGGIDVSLLQSPVLGHHFLRLLRFYGEEFTSPQTTSINADKGRFLPILSPQEHAAATAAGAGGGGIAAALASGFVDPVNIPDPSDARQNVGRNCFRWFQIQQVYRESRRLLAEYALANPPPADRLAGLAAVMSAPPAPPAAGIASGNATELPPSISGTEFPLLGLIISSLRGL